jgi:hypothetical protein
LKRLLMCLALAVPSMSAATVIVQNLTGEGGAVATAWFGQDFTTPGGGPWNNLAFNFYNDYPPTTPSAAGTAYLFSEAYAGSPSGLNSGDAGFIASSTSVAGGVYSFAPFVNLEANTAYWIYEDASLPTSGGNEVANEPAYLASTSNSNFEALAATANFTLSSTTPEPESLFTVLVGLIAITLIARRPDSKHVNS